MKSLSLSTVNGTCCVRVAVPGWMEPKWIGNNFPTTESARDVARFLDIDESKLSECEVKERYPGEYYVANHPTCPRTAPVGVALSLANGAQTLSVRADIEDYPPPRTTYETRYEDGKWWKNMKRGWIRA